MDADHGVNALEAGYATSHRLYELGGIALTTLTGAWLAARLVGSARLSWLVPATLVGLAFADLVSGVVHWAFDTFGDLDTPVVGRLAIRAFRQHHLDPTVMLRHDFVETNGHNFALASPLTLGGLWLTHGVAGRGAVFAALCLMTSAVAVSLTSQIHKWAHAPRVPRAVVALQRLGLVLSPAHHRLHHLPPHRDNFCITVGWLNAPLRALRAFSWLERLVERATGAAPHRG